MGGTVCSPAPAPSGFGDETEKGRKRKRKTDPVAAPPAAPAPSAHRSSERAGPALPALRGRGRPKPGGGAANPARNRSTRPKSPPVLPDKEVGGWARHRPTRGTYHCVPAQALPSSRPRLRPFPTRPRPSLPAATPHCASRCGLAGFSFPGGGRPSQGLHGPIASSSDFLEPPRKRRTQISEAWKPALKLLLPNPRLLKSPFHPDSVSGGTHPRPPSGSDWVRLFCFLP